MKPFALIAAGAACIAAGISAGRPAPVPAAQPAASVVAFQDVKVFDGDRFHEGVTVVVRDGLIDAIGSDVRVPSGAAVVDGRGRTLMPGLIDAHTHTFGNALERALVFGVTTEIDMFTDHRQAAEWRREQREGRAPTRADIVSAGTMVTAPKGHGTQYGMPIPTIERAEDAQAFVDARLGEGSDFIKIVFEDSEGLGAGRPSIDEQTLRAVIAAARAKDALVVVHVSSQRAADKALEAGAHGLVHIFADSAPTPGFVKRAREAGAFVIPTLAVLESVTGKPGSLPLLEVETLAPYFTPAERAELKATFPGNPGGRVQLPYALDAVRQLHAAGVPILAGSDAPNPGTMHGATLHRELELLVQAGLSPLDALRAATATPSRAFRLDGRGRLVAGARADLVLVDGDPERDITATRRIVDVWKAGVRLDRRPAPTAAALAATVGTGVISDFEQGDVSAAFGAGWQVSTDTMMGGASEARLSIVKPGAAGSTGALEITGTIAGSSPVVWAGAMFFPGPTPMAPMDLSRFKTITFKARADGREYQVMLFSAQFGNQPLARAFTPGSDWQEFEMPIASFSPKLDGSDITGLLFSAGLPAGNFRLQIDDVRLR